MSARTQLTPTYPASLRAARLGRQLTQEAMAAQLGVRQNYISNLECGRRTPGPMFRSFLGLFFGVPVDVVASWFATEEKKAA